MMKKVLVLAAAFAACGAGAITVTKDYVDRKIEPLCTIRAFEDFCRTNSVLIGGPYLPAESEISSNTFSGAWMSGPVWPYRRWFYRPMEEDLPWRPVLFDFSAGAMVTKGMLLNDGWDGLAALIQADYPDRTITTQALPRYVEARAVEPVTQLVWSAWHVVPSKWRILQDDGSALTLRADSIETEAEQQINGITWVHYNSTTVTGLASNISGVYAWRSRVHKHGHALESDRIADRAEFEAGISANAAAVAGRATTNETAAIGRSVNALWQYTFGDRAWIAVTNYMRTAEGVVPSLQLWEVRDGATNCVYSSGEEIAHIVSNEVGRIALVFSNLLEGVRAQIPATAWSAFQSMSGAPNPASNEVTVVSTPSVMLTGGAEWQQYVDVSSNSLWVLSSKGVTIAGSDTNGYFRIYDAEGKTAFEIVKEKAVTVPAIPQGNMRPPGDTGTMSVTFIAKTQPTLWLSPTLSPPAFVEASEDSNASVSWTDNKNGTWTAAIDFVNVYDMYFAYATYVEPGTTVVKNNAPMRVDGGIVTSDGKKIKPVVSGSAVSWEVVAE